MKKKHMLYTAFLLTTFGDRLWMFVIGLFMNRLGGVTWVAVQQLFDSSLKVGFLMFIGPHLDGANRSTVIQYSLSINNIAIAISAMFFGFMFHFEAGNPSFYLLGFATLIACVSRCASEIQKICFTKDWVIVIARAENINLEKLNSRMSMFDQSSNIVLPLLAGVLLDKVRWEYVCLVIFGYNIVSWGVESFILRRLYNETEQLHTKGKGIEGEETECLSCTSWSTYFRQSSVLAGFGLSLLYLTVLGFDNLAVAYGQNHGVSAWTVGVMRTAGAMIGVLGAFSFERFAKWFGLLWTVVIGLVWQNIFINMSGASVFLPGSSMNVEGFYNSHNISTWITEVGSKVGNPENHDVAVVDFWSQTSSILFFFAGITFARFGLWLADPAITQIQQETIPEQQRYTVFSIQSSLNEIFSIIKDFVVILLPFTSMFGVLVLGSCCFVFAGFVCNIIYHIKCGVSCSNKSMHLPKESEHEMIPIQKTAEQEPLMSNGNGTTQKKSSTDKEPIVEKHED